MYTSGEKLLEPRLSNCRSKLASEERVNRRTWCDESKPDETTWAHYKKAGKTSQTLAECLFCAVQSIPGVETRCNDPFRNARNEGLNSRFSSPGFNL